jgi:hypothetical protein
MIIGNYEYVRVPYESIGEYYAYVCGFQESEILYEIRDMLNSSPRAAMFTTENGDYDDLHVSFDASKHRLGQWYKVSPVQPTHLAPLPNDIMVLTKCGNIRWIIGEHFIDDGRITYPCTNGFYVSENEILKVLK